MGWGGPPAEGPGLQVPGAHGLVAARRRVFHSVRHQPKGRESQTKRQRRGGEPACVFGFKLFLSPRSPGSHMLPATSPESSRDTGLPSCDETNLPNFRPPPPPPALRLADKVLLEEPPLPPEVSDRGRDAGGEPQSPRDARVLMNSNMPFALLLSYCDLEQCQPHLHSSLCE